jgi:hypothetical protein
MQVFPCSSIELKTVFGEPIIEGDFASFAEAIRSAIGAGKSLRSANLSYADLRYANLSSADLRSADLRSADLSFADLSYADLSSANLRYADLSCAKNGELAIAMTRILPAGSIIGWKKLRDGIIAKIRVPEDAKRSHAFGRKCRAEFAEVLEMFNADGTPFTGVAVSNYESGFTYSAGKIVKPAGKFSEDWTNECAYGIHFFITREEAQDYAR